MDKAGGGGGDGGYGSQVKVDRLTVRDARENKIFQDNLWLVRGMGWC